MTRLREPKNQTAQREVAWLENDAGDSEEDDSYPIDQYDLVSVPNDFNTRTLVDFIDSEVVIIPGFQRNYIWDIKRASRLIESIIVGLPVPQIFLYEQARNRYLVIDGQQRLMSLYYFVKERFPRKAKLAELRFEVKSQGAIPRELLEDDSYFMDFRLNLPEQRPGPASRFHGQVYSGLEDSHRRSMDLRTMRHVIVRQVGSPSDEAMYEIFNRLNSGGVSLKPQEIRRCVFDSPFYDMLYRINTQEPWRQLVGMPPDLHMKDAEILLRGFAMLIREETYRPSMVKFLNQFSHEAKSFAEPMLERLQRLLTDFQESCQKLPAHAFHSSNSRFSPMIFEAVFVAVCSEPFHQQQRVTGKITPESLERLKEDSVFRDATQSQTTGQSNVRKRMARARTLLELV